MYLLDDRIDRRHTVKLRPLPWCWEIPPVHEVPPGPYQSLRWRVFAVAAQDSSCPFWEILQATLEPALKCLTIKLSALGFSHHFEVGVDPRFDWALAKQVTAKGMNRTETCLLEVR